MMSLRDWTGDALGCGGLCGRFAGVALIDIGKFDAVACGVLNVGTALRVKPAGPSRQT